MFQIEYVTIRNIVGDDFVKAKWKLMYELAKQYYEKHGNLLVPYKYVCEDGKHLGTWITTQRIAYKNRTIPKEERNNTISPLTDEQVKLLEDIGMVWSVEKGQFDRKKNHVKWMENYEKAKKYYQKHSNLLVPARYICEDGTQLGQWISAQRVAYKNRTLPKEERNNTRVPLTDEQVKLLEDIGMVWSVEKGQFDRKKNHVKWMENYEKAKKYYQKHSNLLVPARYICEDGTQLGQWISVQRRAYKNRIIPKEERNNAHAPLTDEQVKLLEKIGMVWQIAKLSLKTKIEHQWSKSLKKAENEILTKKYSSKTNEWLTEQFQLQEQNKLTRNQLAMLKNVGVYTTPVYHNYFKQAFLEVFKKVIYYFRDSKTLLEPTDITRLGWTYEAWYEVFNKNELGILKEKQYEVWRKVWLISKQKNKVFKIK